ncbi:hypothetical protein KI688_002910 [Linnemannia hyalina]|uniref:C2H2-type domain-containing protein n=1 Tax=Linnemannia hyalina TaxID=64524 RepID=A0A9P7XPF4_9FUNG|nr:hypothetical protein KI688_002910 [Linnemannia hyalina]
MSTQPSPPTSTTAAAAQGDPNQDQDADISMTSTSSPATATRPESQDTIASQQPPQQRQESEEEVVVEKEVQVLKSEEQEEVKEPQGRVKEEEGSEMEGVVVNEDVGGADGQLSEQESRQQTTITTATTKRTKAAGSKSKKPATGTTRTEDGQDAGEEEVEDDVDEDEEEDEDRKPTTTKSGRAAEEEDELPLSSDDDDEGDEENEDEEGGAGPGQTPNDEEYSNLPEETLCRWRDCGKVLPSLAALVIHLSDEHIGWKKTAYTCEWQGCARRPIAQTTRFALISHMRSHTKHKPYDCPVPECDKSFSRSDAMAKHLKFQHGDVPERFTGRKSRGRYTMKDPAASSTLLHSSSFGAKKRRHPDSTRSETDLPSTSSKHRPTKLRKLGAGGGEEYDEDGYYIGDQQHTHGNSEHRHYHHRSHSDRVILQHLENARRGKGGASTVTAEGGRKKERVRTNTGDDNDENNNEDEDASGDDDSDFETDNGQTPRQRYGLLKAKYDYIHNEREALEAEYEDHKKKLQRLRVEQELLLDALLVSQEEFQDPALQAIEDSD